MKKVTLAGGEHKPYPPHKAGKQVKLATIARLRRLAVGHAVPADACAGLFRRVSAPFTEHQRALPQLDNLALRLVYQFVWLPSGL